jgi:predicted membrane chloride channel (bestrophin family)
MAQQMAAQLGQPNPETRGKRGKRKPVDMPVNPGLGKGYVSPAVPLAPFDEWAKTKPAYAHIPPAPRFANGEWQNNFTSLLKSKLLQRVQSFLVFQTLWSVVCYFLYWNIPILAAAAKILTLQIHSLTGAALSLLLLFRTNSAYARVYDARCIWGQLTNTIREMARLAHTNMHGLDREHALMLTGAIPTLMLNHLQSHDGQYRATQWSEAQKGVLTNLLSEHDFKCIWAARNRPMTACKMLGAVYRSWFINVPALKKQFANKAPDVDLNDDERALMAANIQAAKIHQERQLEIISNCYGACERIVRSNIPNFYSKHLSRFLSVWCFTLPFVLVHRS